MLGKAMWGSTKVVMSREEIGGNCGQELFLQFTEKETNIVGQASFELASLDNFSRFWDLGDLLCYWYWGISASV